MQNVNTEQNQTNRKDVEIIEELDKVVSSIVEDAQSDPEGYVKHVSVPKGGE